MKRFLNFAIAFLLYNASILLSQTVEVDAAACRMILELFQSMKTESSIEMIETRLDSILRSKPYQTMFMHYNRSWRPNHLPEDVFKRMILSLKYSEKYKPGENRRADQMLPKWRKYYDDLPMFEKNIRELGSIDLQNLIDQAVREARMWLPSEMEIPDSYLFIHPNGGSGGFAIGNAQGYDFFQLARDETGKIRLDVFSEIIAHENHHLGLDIPKPAFTSPLDSLAFLFMNLFVGEGTATKFINNASGGCVPRIDSNRENTMMDPSTNSMTQALWQQYTINERDIFARMIDTFEKLVHGKMTGKELDKDIREYWISGMIGRNYFIGSELFGAIYFGFGKEGCFEAMENPRKMFHLYNRSLEKRPDILKDCIEIPRKIAETALTIAPQ